MDPLEQLERVLTETLEKVSAIDTSGVSDVSEQMVFRAVTRSVTLLREDVRVFVEE